MKKMRVLFVAAVMLGIAEMYIFYPQMPERMAVHFNATGAADGWGPKDGFFKAMGIPFAILAILFGTLPLFLKRLPDALINLPNREYWLAPERRDETMSRLAGLLLLLITLTLLMMDGILYLCFRANQGAAVGIPAGLLWAMIGGFVISSGAAVIYILLRFRRP